MKYISILFVTVFFLSFNAAYAQSKTENEEKETKKMEMNHEKMDHSKVDHEMKMNDTEEKVAVKPWNKVCPVRGNEVDPEVRTVEYNGKAYGFCCGGCDKKFSKDPEKYSINLSEDGTEFIGKK